MLVYQRVMDEHGEFVGDLCCKSRDVNPIGIVDCHVRLCNQG